MIEDTPRNNKGILGTKIKKELSIANVLKQLVCTLIFV